MPSDYINDLAEIFNILKDNKCSIEKKDVYDVMTPEGKPFVSIFRQDKHITFHDEFVQIGVEKPGGKELFEFAKKHGWAINHD